MTTILAFPSAPIQGGTFNFDGDRINLSVTQLNTNRFLAVYRQKNPYLTLGQVVDILDKDNVIFNNVWVINGITDLNSFTVKKINEDKALFCGVKSPAPGLGYMQVLEVDSNNDIIAHPLTLWRSTSFPTAALNLSQVSMYDNSIGLVFFNNSTGNEASNQRIARFYVNHSTNSILVSADITKPDGGYSEAGFFSYYDDTITSTISFYGTTNTSNNALQVKKIVFTNPINNLTMGLSLVVSSLTNVNVGETVYGIDMVNMDNNFLYFHVAINSAVSYLYEYNKVANTLTKNTLNYISTNEKSMKILYKIDGLHFVSIDAATNTFTSAGSFISDIKTTIYRSLGPGVVASIASPIVCETSNVRQNAHAILNSGPKKPGLSKNTFMIYPNLLVHFYKTETNYKLFLMHD